MNSTNFSEIICTRINLKLEIGNAVSFLIGCYKRLVVKENLVPPQIVEELYRYARTKFDATPAALNFVVISCKSQLVSFLASCLGVPEMFGELSSHSIQDLFTAIKEDGSATATLLFKELWDELEKQEYLDQVKHSTFSCYVSDTFPSGNMRSY